MLCSQSLELVRKAASPRIPVATLCGKHAAKLTDYNHTDYNH